MKKRLTLIALVLVCALALSACGCKHETWNAATCETPQDLRRLRRNRG